jgi:RNA polymerase sigma factor (sigma-70 family)
MAKRRKPTPPLDEARRGLAERYVPLAFRLARPYRDRWPRLYDEFGSAAMAGLVDAASRFEFVRGINFATYAAQRIDGALRDVLRANRRARRRLARVAADADPSARAFKGFDRVDAADAAASLLAHLEPRRRRALEGAYLLGEEQSEVGAALGVSQSTAWGIIHTALARCREHAAAWT